MTQGGKKPTKAERKEHARKARLEELKRRQRKARMRKIYYGVIVALALAGIVLLIITSGKAGRKKVADVNRIAAQAGCDKVTNPPDQKNSHITPPATFQYSSNPPTSGSHYAGNTPQGPAPALTGVHTSPIQDEIQVHNLEHSHLVIQYKTGLDQDLVTKLEDFVKDHDKQMLIAPRVDMPYELSFTAWDTLVGCKNPNAKAVDLAKAFRDAFSNKGPEGFIAGQPAT
ncbi:MAG: DUF3105 domain-containing protein [Actinomycetota bacterium]|nr:DUF3105 domain-containing protein [Actinomycetota bacterium]